MQSKVGEIQLVRLWLSSLQIPIFLSSSMCALEARGRQHVLIHTLIIICCCWCVSKGTQHFEFCSSRADSVVGSLFLSVLITPLLQQWWATRRPWMPTQQVQQVWQSAVRFYWFREPQLPAAAGPYAFLSGGRSKSSLARTSRSTGSRCRRFKANRFCSWKRSGSNWDD